MLNDVPFMYTAPVQEAARGAVIGNRGKAPADAYCLFNGASICMCRTHAALDD